MRSVSRGIILTIALLVPVSQARAAIHGSTITFSGSHGDVFYSDLDQDGTPDPGFDGTGLHPGVIVTVTNPNRAFNLGVIFDTLTTGATTDGDLVGPPWSGGGNLSTPPPGEVIGGIAIIQENTTGFLPFSTSTAVSDPDDEGSRPAGDFEFDFSIPITSFGFDIVDVEGAVEAFSTLLMKSGGITTTVAFTTLTTRDPTVAFGDNSLNRIIPFTNAELGSGPWDSVTIKLGGSGGVDNVVFTVIPEPSSVAIWSLLGALGLVLQGWQRKRT